MNNIFSGWFAHRLLARVQVIRFYKWSLMPFVRYRKRLWVGEGRGSNANLNVDFPPSGLPFLALRILYLRTKFEIVHIGKR